MTRLVFLPLLALAACGDAPSAPVNTTNTQQQSEAPIRDVDAIPADEAAAAAEGEGDDAPGANALQ